VRQVYAACLAVLLGLVLAAIGAAGHGSVSAALMLAGTAALTTTVRR
jgi:hypothetical protein